MEDSDNTIRDLALSRLSAIFDMPATELKRDLRFGTDLDTSFVSDLHENELDLIDNDIRDVVEKIADPDITKKLASGSLEIWTVDDYCEFMIRCSNIDTQCVKRLLAETPPKIPTTRRIFVDIFLFTVFGILVVIVLYFVYVSKKNIEFIYLMIWLAVCVFIVVWINAGTFIKDLLNKVTLNLKSRKR
jgi:hypothetical protein